jgi:hypothetical protein
MEDQASYGTQRLIVDTTTGLRTSMLSLQVGRLVYCTDIYYPPGGVGGVGPYTLPSDLKMYVWSQQTSKS